MTKKKDINETELINETEKVEEIENAEKSEVDILKEELEESKNRYMYLLAEYDNYKKRTAKEKLEAKENGVISAIEKLLPVVDNLERAIASDGDYKSLKEGVEMVLKQTLEIFSNMGVCKIDAVNLEFDPNVHNAVMHIEDENLDKNIVVEEFLAGYKMGDKVIRHSMVKVAN